VLDSFIPVGWWLSLWGGGVKLSSGWIKASSKVVEGICQDMVTFWELELHSNCSQNKQEERDAMDELHPSLLREFTYGKLRLVDLLVGVTICLRL
jgi:hypothetical protein